MCTEGKFREEKQPLSTCSIRGEGWGYAGGEEGDLDKTLSGEEASLGNRPSLEAVGVLLLGWGCGVGWVRRKDEARWLPA